MTVTESVLSEASPKNIGCLQNDEICRFCPQRPLSDLSGTGNGL
ncbi:hypothetical protein [Xenorhabdus bovienii]|nr:hypothetical protein [Xenorhabdus bovienii]